MQGQHCPACGSRTWKQQVRFVSPGDEPVIITGIPAEVCERCGTEVLSAAASMTINRVARERPAPARWVQVPVYAFDAIDEAADAEIEAHSR